MAIDDDIYGGSYGASTGDTGGGGGGPLDLGSFSNGGGGGSGSFFNQSNVSGGVGLAGLGLQIGSTLAQASDEAKYTQTNIATAQLEGQVNQQRRLAMQINARRQQTQQLRTAQMAQARSLSTSVGQGAQFSTSAQAGQQQATAEGAYNLQGINQNLMVANSIFDLDQQITNQRIQGFEAQSAANTAGAWGAIGGDILKAAPTIAQFAMFA